MSRPPSAAYSRCATNSLPNVHLLLEKSLIATTYSSRTGKICFPHLERNSIHVTGAYCSLQQACSTSTAECAPPFFCQKLTQICYSRRVWDILKQEFKIFFLNAIRKKWHLTQNIFYKFISCAIHYLKVSNDQPRTSVVFPEFVLTHPSPSNRRNVFF